jgi:hypothetical protein
MTIRLASINTFAIEMSLREALASAAPEAILMLLYRGHPTKVPGPALLNSTCCGTRDRLSSNLTTQTLSYLIFFKKLRAHYLI